MLEWDLWETKNPQTVASVRQRALIVHDSTEFGVGEQESCLIGGVSTTIYILYVETSFHSNHSEFEQIDKEIEAEHSKGVNDKPAQESEIFY